MSDFDVMDGIVKHLFDVLPGKNWQECKNNFREDADDDDE